MSDSVDALKELATYARRRFTGDLTVITGTAGKTTTRAMVARILSDHKTVHQNRQNWNFRRHLLEEMASAPADCRFIVLEMGLGEKGVGFGPTSTLLQPTAGILTTVGMGHLDVLEDPNSRNPVEAILRAKLDAFSGMASGAPLLLNGDNPYIRAHVVGLRDARNILTFGESADCDVQLVDFVQKKRRSQFRVRFADDYAIDAALSVPGRAMALNATAAIALARHFNVPPSVATQALRRFRARGSRARPMRVTLVGGGEALLLDDCFNANSVSMVAALDVLRDLGRTWGGRRIAVLGDLYEHHTIGDNQHYYEQLADSINAGGVDCLLTVGPGMRRAYELVDEGLRAGIFDDTESLQAHLMGFIQPSDVVLFKASGHMEFRQLVRTLASQLRANA